MIGQRARDDLVPTRRRKGLLVRLENSKSRQCRGGRNESPRQGYIREAEAVGLNVGTPFPPLPVSLLQSSNESSTVDDSIDGPALKKLKTKRPQRDSNPCYSLERAVSWAG